jgi:hypothetical protein
LNKIGEKPRILFTHQITVPFRESVDSQRIITATIKTTTHAIDAALKFLHSDKSIELPKDISSVHYVLSSPWILSEAKRLEVTFDEKKTVTEDLVRKMIRDEREKMSAGVRAMGKTEEVEEKIFEVNINGYSVSHWQGKVADSLSISFVTSISGIKMVERFKEMCAHVARGRDIHFHSSLLLQHIGMSRIFPDLDTYIIVHVHGEVTDVVEIKNHGCVFFCTYPVGTQTILRSLASYSRIGIKTAMSLLLLHSSGLVDKKISETSNRIKITYELWTEELDKSLKMGPLHVDQPISMIVSTSERQNDFVRLLNRKYPQAQVEILNIDDILLHVNYDLLPERSVMLSLYAIATSSLRPI